MAGALVFKYVERIGLKNNKVISRSKIAEGLGRPRDVVQAPDGYIYVSIENKLLIAASIQALLLQHYFLNDGQFYCQIPSDI